MPYLVAVGSRGPTVNPPPHCLYIVCLMVFVYLARCLFPHAYAVAQIGYKIFSCIYHNHLQLNNIHSIYMCTSVSVCYVHVLMSVKEGEVTAREREREREREEK